MIIGLTGYAQSGKDTIANILVEKYGFKRVAFADKIKELLYEMNPHVGGDTYLRSLVDSLGWERAKKNPEVRAMLQNLGVGARNLFGEHFWIAQAVQGLNWKEDYVFTDVRFTNEADLLKKWTDEGTQIWRVKRVGVDAVNSHVSESQMDNYKVDQIFINNGTLDDLEALIKARMIGLLHDVYGNPSTLST